MTQYGTVEQRFWSRVDATGGLDACWPWLGYLDAKGYGQIAANGHMASKAHRVSLQLTGVPVPPTGLVLHTCDNPPCVNPAHLRVGTHSENRRDMYARGRQPVTQRPWPICKRGHGVSGENLLATGSRRMCRICRRASEGRRRIRDRLKRFGSSVPGSHSEAVLPAAANVEPGTEPPRGSSGAGRPLG